MRRALPVLIAAGGAAAGGAYWLALTGRLTVDVGWGRRLQPLGPFTVAIRAPAEVVFDVIAEPYLGRTTRAMATKLRVLDRGQDMVLAEHHTEIWRGTAAVTVETVTFSRPDRVGFRLVRGPVPHVVEEFKLTESEGITTLGYSGELGTDLGVAGSCWGRVVARSWEQAVRSSLERIEAEAERRARA